MAQVVYGAGMKCSTFGVSRSKVKLKQSRNRSQKSF